MYDDEIVLLSESKEGLQNCLHNFSQYCNLWKLEVNLNKMVFNNEFLLEWGLPLESVRDYKYLSVVFSLSGSFSLAIDNITTLAMKASFKLKKLIDPNNVF
jgi:hypothetical protein